MLTLRKQESYIFLLKYCHFDLDKTKNNCFLYEITFGHWESDKNALSTSNINI